MTTRAASSAEMTLLRLMGALLSAHKRNTFNSEAPASCQGRGGFQKELSCQLYRTLGRPPNKLTLLFLIIMSGQIGLRGEKKSYGHDAHKHYVQSDRPIAKGREQHTAMSGETACWTEASW